MALCDIGLSDSQMCLEAEPSLFDASSLEMRVFPCIASLHGGFSSYEQLLSSSKAIQVRKEKSDGAGACPSRDQKRM